MSSNGWCYIIIIFRKLFVVPFWAILTLVILFLKKNHEMFCHVSRLTKWFPCSQQKEHHAANKILTFSTFSRWDQGEEEGVRAWRTGLRTRPLRTWTRTVWIGPFDGGDDELDLWVIGFSPFLVRFLVLFGLVFVSASSWIQFKINWDGIKMVLTQTV